MNSVRSIPLFSRILCTASAVFFGTAALFLISCTGQASSLGVVLGGPTGITYSQEIESRKTFQVAFGLDDLDGGGIQANVDYVYHFDSLGSSSPVMYAGIGLRLRQRGSADSHADESEETEFGVRVPLGVRYLLGDSTAHVFLEIGPGINLSDGDDSFVDWNIGVRWRL